MRTMKFILLISYAFLTTAAGADALVGKFEGTGRSCYGPLVITRDSAKWNTPFSKCANGPYRLLNVSASNDGARTTIELLKRSASCGYRVLSLSKKRVEGDELWEVIAYVTRQDYERDVRSGFTASIRGRMGCALVRLS